MFITREHIEEVDNLTKQGLTVKAAATEVGISFNGATYAAQKYGIQLQRVTLLDRVIARADEIRTSDRTQKWWAQELNTTQSAIGIAFKQAGLQTLRGQQRSKTGDERIADYRKVIGHIAANGGYMPHVLKALDLKLQPQPIRDFARSIGFDLKHYQFAWQRYGHWMVLPGPWTRPQINNYIVPALCTLCDEKSHVSLINLRMKQSTKCCKCSQGNGGSRTVVNAVTGETYKSIMRWAKDIGQLKRYQQLRIELINDGQTTVDGIKYILPDYKHEEVNSPVIAVDVTPQSHLVTPETTPAV
jgi:hypothetical protein